MRTKRCRIPTRTRCRRHSLDLRTGTRGARSGMGLARLRCSRRAGRAAARDRVGRVVRFRGVRRLGRRLGMGMDTGPGMDMRRSRMRKGGGNAYVYCAPAHLSSISLAVYYTLRSVQCSALPPVCLFALGLDHNQCIPITRQPSHLSHMPRFPPFLFLSALLFFTF